MCYEKTTSLCGQECCGWIFSVFYILKVPKRLMCGRFGPQLMAQLRVDWVLGTNFISGLIYGCVHS